MATRLPIIHIERLTEQTDGRFGRYRTDALAALVDALAEADVQTPSAAFLAAGYCPVTRIERPALLTTEETRLGWLAFWCQRLAGSTYSSILFVDSDTFDRKGHLSAGDLPLVTGSGVAIASQGATGRPLVGLDVAELRRELQQSRQRLSDAAGYPIRMLAPRPTATGRCLDGLVVREARRAGYSLFLKRGSAATLDSPEPDAPLGYYTVADDDPPESLRDWVLGRLLARGSTRIKQLVSGPRQLIERLQPD